VRRYPLVVAGVTLVVGGKRAASLIQGTAQLTRMTPTEAEGLLDAVTAEGATTFDLAENYGRGVSEAAFGRWLASRGGRHSLFLITKGGHPYDGRNRVTEADVSADLFGSLERLGTDAVDLYLLHRDDEDVPVGEVIDMLHAHVQAGLVGAYGVSNWRWERIAAANDYALSRGLPPLAASSNHFSLAVPLEAPWPGSVSIAGPAKAKEREFYLKTGMPVLAWSSLAMGYFAATADTPAPQQEVSVFDTPANAGRRDRVMGLARARGLTPSQVALAYTLSQPMSMHAIVGCRSGAEFRELRAAAELQLTPAELSLLEG
jgi:aryl-alcohol dehydrogenase-like predicted oxidoreductase